MVFKVTKMLDIETGPDGHQICTVKCMEYSNKYIYVGEFERGADNELILDGKGKVSLEEDGTVVYDGELKNNKKEGNGIEYYSDGGRYEGNWENDVANGWGIYYDPDGGRYEGNWENDVKNGWGTCYDPDGGRYEGNWENDVKNGWGTCYDQNGGIYEGNWENDVINGWGTCYYLDGGRYEGNWENNKMHGQGIFTDHRGCVYERLYSEDSLEEQTAMSQEFYRENGEVGDGDSGKRRKLYTAKYDENGCSTVTYNHYGSNGILGRKLKVDYRKLNELLNEGRLDSIVSEAIEDVTEGLRENEKIGTLVEAQKCLEACARQYLQDKMHSGEQGLEGGTRELENLMLLAGLLGGPEIEKARFSDKPNEEKMKQRYDNVGAILESLGINPDAIENTTEDFIVTVISTTNGGHSVSAIIDLKRLRELKRNGENIAITSKLVIFIFDSSRVIGNPDPRCKEYNLGNIQEKNCMVVNGNIQNLGSCWYHAVSSTVAVAENPDIVRDLRESVRVERSKSEGQSPWEFWSMGRQLARFVGFANPEVQSIRELPRPRNKLLTGFEAKQMLQLQRTANRYGIGRIDGQTTSKLIVREHVRDGLKKFSADDTLLSTFEERIGTLIEKRGKEMGANFSEETRKSLGEEYKNTLSGEIGKITLESIRKKYNTEADLEGEKFLQVLERTKVFHDMEREFSEMLSRIELVKNDVGLPEIRKPVALESWLGFAGGDKNRDRTVSPTTIAPPNAVSSSSMAEGISNAGDDNENFRESKTLTEAEELSRVEGALESLSSEVTRELTK